jgi:hypothetical protein
MSARNTTSDAFDSIRAEFSSAYADDIDKQSALAHVRAIVILAASGKGVTESSYLAALNVVDSNEARRTDEDEVGERCRAAQALSDLAEENLRQRGVFWSSGGFEQKYVEEVGRIARESGLDYFPGRKGA